MALGVQVPELINIDLLLKKVLVALEWVELLVVVVVWWSVVLLEGGELLTTLLALAHLVAEVV